MRPLVEALSKIASASAIAASAIERAFDTEDVFMWKRLDTAAMDAMRAFPGKLSKKEMAILQSKLSEFFGRMGWEDKPKHPQTMLIFSSELLSNLRYELVQHNADISRIKALDRLIEAEVNIYDYYQSQARREYALCNVSGLAAADEWERIWA